jgi:hypothetical protein
MGDESFLNLVVGIAAQFCECAKNHQTGLEVWLRVRALLPGDWMPLGASRKGSGQSRPTGRRSHLAPKLDPLSW